LTADSLDLCTLLFSWCSCGGTSHIAPPDMPRAWSTEPSVDCPLKFPGADITSTCMCFSTDRRKHVFFNIRGHTHGRGLHRFCRCESLSDGVSGYITLCFVAALLRENYHFCRRKFKSRYIKQRGITARKFLRRNISLRRCLWIHNAVLCGGTFAGENN